MGIVVHIRCKGNGFLWNLQTFPRFSFVKIQKNEECGRQYKETNENNENNYPTNENIFVVFVLAQRRRERRVFAELVAWQLDKWEERS